MSTARIVLWAALSLLVLSVGAFGLSELLHRDRYSRKVVAAPVHRIVIHADRGDVDIRAGLTRNVVVRRHDVYLVDRPSARERFGDGTLDITTSCGGLSGVLRCRTDLTIDAPPEVDVVVRTKTGDVDLRGLSGRADIQTDSGDIATHRLEPVVVRAKSDAGDVSLDLVGEPTRTEAHADAGDVRVTVPFGPYRVDARAAGQVRIVGLIRDDLAPQAIDALADSGDITVRAR